MLQISVALRIAVIVEDPVVGADKDMIPGVA